MPYELSFSKEFEVSRDDPDFYINDCCWGGDVVIERLLPLLEGNYESIRTCQEDWGWFIWFRKGGQRFEINIQCDVPQEGEFRIHLVAFRRNWMFRRLTSDTPELESLRETVTKELQAWTGKVMTTRMSTDFRPI